MVNFKFANSARRESTSREGEGEREGEGGVVLADIFVCVLSLFSLF